MITGPVVLLGFSIGGDFISAMLRDGTGIRKRATSAVCALIVSCLLIPAMKAGQDSSSETASKKSSTATKKTSTSHKHSSSKSAASGTTKSSSKTHTTSSGKRLSRKKSARVRGQQKIDSERAQSIQEALIRQHYLNGEATGTWNQASEEAMRRYQADHGWQSKTVPDSRALISLGLGPSKDHLLNPESAMTTVPDPPKSESMPTTSHTGSTAADPVSPAVPSATSQNDSSRPQ